MASLNSVLISPVSGCIFSVDWPPVGGISLSLNKERV